MDNLLLHAKEDLLIEKASKLIKEQGIVQIRGLVDAEDLDIINKKLKNIFENPALGGSIGYTQKDPHKKVYDALFS